MISCRWAMLTEPIFLAGFDASLNQSCQRRGRWLFKWTRSWIFLRWHCLAPIPCSGRKSGYAEACRHSQDPNIHNRVCLFTSPTQTTGRQLFSRVTSIPGLHLFTLRNTVMWVIGWSIMPAMCSRASWATVTSRRVRSFVPYSIVTRGAWARTISSSSSS